MRERCGRGALAVLAVAALASAGCAADGSGAGGGGPDRVRVAAAANLAPVLDDLAALVVDEHPGVELVVTYGSSGTFVQQLANGAPFDLFLSADSDHPRRVVAEGLAAPEAVFRYADGRLALWVGAGVPVDPADGLDVLADPAVRTVAVASPEHAPYGEAASAALAAAGVADEVHRKLVVGENVSQAAEFVRSGNADAGVVALPLLVGTPAGRTGRWAQVPAGLFPPLEQAGVVLSAAAEPEAARAVRDVLLSPRGQALLADHGYTPAG